MPCTVLFDVRVCVDPAVVTSEDNDSMDRLLGVKVLFMVDALCCCRVSCQFETGSTQRGGAVVENVRIQ